MKRFFFLFTVAAFLISHALASGQYCDEPPQEVLDLIVENGMTDDLRDYIAFTTPEGEQYGYAISPFGWMQGFRLQNGEWETILQSFPVDSLWEIRFVRHDTQTPRADGSFYPDALGFDLICERIGNKLSFHYNGLGFSLCGWRNPQAYAGEAILSGNTLAYYSDGQTTPEAAYALDQSTVNWMHEFDRLPATPEAARELASVMESSVADLFPGYTLRSFESYNDGYDTVATYSRIEDGILTLKRAEFSSAGLDREIDSMPVPLSESLLAKLEQAPFESLIDAGGYDSFFLTEDPLDSAQIPVTGTILQSELQSHALFLLTEDEQDARQLTLVTRGEGGYSLNEPVRLPADCEMDLFHSTDGDISLLWQQDGEYRHAGYARMADGTWRLQWVMNSGDGAFNYSVVFCGVRLDGGPVRVCSLADGRQSLLGGRLEALPRTQEELLASFDREGWAVVNNPNPADRLHLRTAPDRSAPSLGKFYNGTPVTVHEEDASGKWCRVSIGTDGGLTGWMMKEYLAFGERMDVIERAFPQKTFVDSLSDRRAYTALDCSDMKPICGDYWLCGVVEDKLYVIVTDLGETGYAPQGWFWDGNG